jgi:plastocyanin
MMRPNLSRAATIVSGFAFAITVAALLIAGCGSDDKATNNTGGPGPAADDTITIFIGKFNAGANAFSPPRDTVQAGKTVKMLNLDTMLHNINTVTVGGPSWGNLSAGSGNNVIANLAGTYNYKCFIGGHNMTGVIVVIP